MVGSKRFKLLVAARVYRRERIRSASSDVRVARLRYIGMLQAMDAHSLAERGAAKAPCECHWTRGGLRGPRMRVMVVEFHHATLEGLRLNAPNLMRR
jgi:hypothetical protein